MPAQAQFDHFHEKVAKIALNLSKIRYSRPKRESLAQVSGSCAPP
jgi:hypothetical protein